MWSASEAGHLETEHRISFVLQFSLTVYPSGINTNSE